MNPSPEPFTLHVPDAAITDLHTRLAHARFPDQPPGEPWAYGTNVDWLRDLAAYWREGFDWRAQEARINEFDQYTVPLHDINLHFLQVPGQGPNPCPLLLMHGWPGSVVEFLDIIPRLTDPARFGGDPADAFTVIAPSLPGFTLSFTPGQPRFGARAMADCFAELMTEVLGYSRFAVQGGDWGAFIAARLGHVYPDRLMGIHLNLLTMVPNPHKLAEPTAEEQRYAEELAAWSWEETGYQWIQGTRPQTLAFGLTDSPVGLAAWIAEKFRTWSDCGSDVEAAFTRDQLLTNISLYWFTGAIGSSFWPYYARMHEPRLIPNDGTVPVPTGYSEFPREILHPPRSLAEQTYTDLHHWHTMDAGGHFAAMEQPKALAWELHEFFRPLRQDP